MKIHEYQAKELLAAAGANVPRHIVCKSPDEVAAAFDQLAAGGGVVVKAQVHAGGRGAGQLMGYPDKLGGVKFVTSKEKAKAVAEAMLTHALKTKQTGPEGTKIQTLIVQADADPAKEFYVAMVLDRAQGVPILMASAEGGRIGDRDLDSSIHRPIAADRQRAAHAVAAALRGCDLAVAAGGGVARPSLPGDRCTALHCGERSITGTFDRERLNGAGQLGTSIGGERLQDAVAEPCHPSHVER